jgi:hypothetical protein
MRSDCPQVGHFYALSSTKENAQELVQASLLDLPQPPSGGVCLRDLERVRQSFLGESERFPGRPDLAGPKEPGRQSKGVNQPAIGVVVQDDRAAVLASGLANVDDQDPVRGSTRSDTYQRNRIDGTLATIPALPRGWLHALTPCGWEPTMRTAGLSGSSSIAPVRRRRPAGIHQWGE